MPGLEDRLIVALDVATIDEAKRLVDILYPKVKIFKVGSQLFTTCGPDAVRMVGKKGAKVFLDLKFHDIPNTVFSAVASGTSTSCELLSYESVSVPTTPPNAEENVRKVTQFPVFMMTVHIKGNKEMLEKAVAGAESKAEELKIKRPYIVGVTVLTSEKNGQNTQDTVLGAARFAKAVGLDGVVCSVYEAPMIRKEFGKDFLIVTPGIRPKDYPADDQKRTTTASEAIAAGADYIVVGRPIIQAKYPLKATEEILSEIK